MSGANGNGTDHADSSRTFYKLAEGTPDERQVPWAAGRHLHEAADQIFPRLAQMHAAACNQTLNKPLDTQQGLFVEALFMLWCYASHDVRRLKGRIEALEQNQEALRHAVEEVATGGLALQDETSEISASVTRLNEVVAAGGKEDLVLGPKAIPVEAGTEDEHIVEDMLAEAGLTPSMDVFITLIGRETLGLSRTLLDQFTESLFTMTNEAICTEVDGVVGRLQALARALRAQTDSEDVQVSPATSDDDEVPF